MAFNEVRSQFAAANSYAQSSAGRADSFVAALNSVAAGLSAPNIDLSVDWPSIPSIEAADTVSVTLPSTTFPVNPVTSFPGAPSISVLEDAAPGAPALPSYTFTPGTMPERPQAPSLQSVTIPTAPTDWVVPTMPALLSINVLPFGGMNPHTEWLTRLDDTPGDLVLAAPTPYTDPAVGRYSSDLLSQTSRLLQDRLNGGTGLPPEIEQAIWDRARTREAASNATLVSDVIRNAEQRGFMLPTGALNAALLEANRQLVAKTAELSRDVAMKQADLEQANLKHAIENGIALEARLIDYANNIEQRAFESARFAAQNAVEIYNALVGKFRAVLERFSTVANVYNTLISAERSKVEAYRAQVDAERAKADVNTALLGELRAQIDIRNSQIAVYQAQLEATKTLVEVDKTKIESFGEVVRAYTAEISAETVRVEAYKAQLQGNATLADVYKTQVEAWSSVLSTRAQVARTKAEAYASSIQGETAKAQAYASQVGAEAEKLRALVGVEGLKVDAGKLSVERVKSSNDAQIEFYRALLSQYEAAKTISIQHTKMLSDNYFALKSIVADASKVGASVNAQLAASAYGMLHAAAQISGSDSTNVGFSYVGNTSDEQGMPSLA